MDPQNFTASSEWKLPFTTTSKPPSIISTSSNSKTASVYAPTTQSGSLEYPEIAPLEASICDRLEREILHAAPNPTAAPPSRSSESTISGPTPLLAAVLERTAVVVRYHAKWFAPSPLSSLLHTALAAASNSSATADLEKALDLIKIIATYSTIPQLTPVVRFIAYVYYQGSRSNRHRKLSQDAWTVAEQILDSHLRKQFTSAVLDIIRDSQDLSVRIKVASIIGALMIAAEKLMSSASSSSQLMIPVQLLTSLRKTDTSNSVVLCEYILTVLGDMLLDDETAQQIDEDASLGLCLELVKFFASFPIADEAKESALRGLELRASGFELRYQGGIALLFLDNHRPLTSGLSAQLVRTWQHSFLAEEQMNWAKGYRDLLSKMCTCSCYRAELKAFVEISVTTFFHIQDFGTRKDFVSTLESLIVDDKTTHSSADVLAQGIVRLFEFNTQDQRYEQIRNWLFPILCGVAKICPRATELLVRIRADASGDGYIEFEHDHDSTSSPEIVHRAPTLQGLWSLQLNRWVDTICDVLEQESQQWTVYSILLKSLASQLRNHALWADHSHHVNVIRRVICDKLNKDAFVDPPADTNMTKSYVISELVQILTATISYHSQLPRGDVKAAIVTCISVAGSRDHSVSIHCIHALTVCCNELPELMAGYMDAVVNKMSKMVTQRYLAIYVLEFFAGLSRLPTLYGMLRQGDFKRILGVCHSYLQSIRSSSTPERKQTPNSDRSVGMSSSSSEEMAGYVHALAHHVIAFWYVSLQKQDRDALKDYISSCLKYEGNDGREHIEDQGLVTIDMMDRIDAEEQITVPEGDVFDRNDGRTITRHRINGLLLITTETALRTGKTLVTIRRPSGTSRGILSSEETRDPGTFFTASFTVENDTENFINVFPDDLSGRTYGKVALPRPSSVLGSLETITLPDNDEAVIRSIQGFDRTSALDSHKAGIIYIGEGQSTEPEILLNQAGSPDYRDFLEDMGSLRKLKDATFNSQGLDRHGDFDGEYTLVWNNDVTELVYHITTFMPNGPVDSETVVRKKSHIGNDFVNIIFNNSGAPFRFNTFPSAFNAVYIVISPAERTSFVQARTITSRNDRRERFYNVHVLTRPGYPPLSSSSEVKVISGTSLGRYVRNQALNACVFSLMWTGDDVAEYPSSWRRRLHMIKRLYSQRQRLSRE